MSKQAKWSRSRVVEVVRGLSPDEPLNTSVYQALRASHDGELPSITRIFDLFGSWDGFRLSVWGVDSTVWDKSRCLQALKQELLTPVNSVAYRKLAKNNQALPSEKVLYQFFDTWATLVLEVWGEPIGWTRERIELALKRHFKTAPTIQKLEALALTDSSLPNGYQCAKAFGSYRHMKEVVFGQRSYIEARGKARPVFDDATLIRLMRQAFPIEPNSVNSYNQQTSHLEWMPAGKTYLKHFGSWEDAMMACYPDRPYPQKPRRWTPEKVLEFILLAYDDLKDSLTGTSYRKWAMSREDAPSLNSVLRQFGTFAEAAKVAGISVSAVKTNTIWTKTSIDEALRRYRQAYPESDWKCSTYANQTGKDPSYPLPNSIYYHYRSFKEAMASVVPDKQLKLKMPKERKTREACEQSLKVAYEAMGEPLTQARYQKWRETHPSAPSRMAIVSNFGSWKGAAQAVGANGNRVSAYQAAVQESLLTLQVSKPNPTLQDLLQQLEE